MNLQLSNHESSVEHLLIIIIGCNILLGGRGNLKILMGQIDVMVPHHLIFDIRKYILDALQIKDGDRAVHG